MTHSLMEISERQQQLLHAIIHEYIDTARPVSSSTLVTVYGFDYSPATIRNDMADLELQGLITQPHTSAGRVPTEKGYHYYIQHFVQQQVLPKKSYRVKLEEVAKSSLHLEKSDVHQLLKNVARVLSEVTGETVFLAFENGDYVVAGLSHLFHKPDFTDVEQILALSDAFDRMEEITSAMREQMPNGNTHIFIGDENPFSHECSTIVALLPLPRNRHTEENVLGIVGPMRMNYEKNLALLSYLDNIIHRS